MDDLASQAKHCKGPLFICYLELDPTWVDMCFVTLLVFACVPIPWELRLDAGKSTLGTMTNATCMIFGTNNLYFFIALANTKNNLLISPRLIEHTLKTRELLLLTTSMLRM